MNCRYRNGLLKCARTTSQRYYYRRPTPTKSAPVLSPKMQTKRSSKDRLELWRDAGIEKVSFLEYLELNVVTGRNMEQLCQAANGTNAEPIFLGVAAIRSLKQDNVKQAIDFFVRFVERYFHNAQSILIVEMAACIGTAIACYAYSLDNIHEFARILEILCKKNLPFYAPGKLISKAIKNFLTLCPPNGGQASKDRFDLLYIGLFLRTYDSEPNWYRSVNDLWRKHHLIYSLKAREHRLPDKQTISLPGILSSIKIPSFEMSLRDKFRIIFEKAMSTPNMDLSTLTVDDWRALSEMVTISKGSPYWVKVVASNEFKGQLPEELIPTTEEANYKKYEKVLSPEQSHKLLLRHLIRTISWSYHRRVDWTILLESMNGLELPDLDILALEAYNQFSDSLKNVKFPVTPMQADSLLLLLTSCIQRQSDFALALVNPVCQSIIDEDLISKDLYSTLCIALSQLHRFEQDSELYLELLSISTSVLEKQKPLIDRVDFLSQILDSSNDKGIPLLAFEALFYASMSDELVPNRPISLSSSRKLELEKVSALVQKIWHYGLWSPRLEIVYFETVGWPSDPKQISQHLEADRNHFSHLSPAYVLEMFDVLAHKSATELQRGLLSLMKFPLQQKIPQEHVTYTRRTIFRRMIFTLGNVEQRMQFLLYLHENVALDREWIHKTFELTLGHDDRSWYNDESSVKALLSTISCGVCPIAYLWNYYFSDRFDQQQHLTLLQNAIREHYASYNGMEMLNTVTETQNPEILLQRLKLLHGSGVWSSSEVEWESLEKIFRGLVQNVLVNYDTACQSQIVDYLISREMVPSESCVHFLVEKLPGYRFSDHQFKLLAKLGFVDVLFMLQYGRSWNWSPECFQNIASLQMHVSLPQESSSRLSDMTHCFLAELETMSDTSASQLVHLTNNLNVKFDIKATSSHLSSLSQVAPSRALMLLTRLFKCSHPLPIRLYKPIIDSAIIHDVRNLEKVWDGYLDMLRRQEIDALTAEIATVIFGVIIKHVKWNSLNVGARDNFASKVLSMVQMIGRERGRFPLLSNLPESVMDTLYTNLDFDSGWSLCESLRIGFAPSSDTLALFLQKIPSEVLKSKALNLIESAQLDQSSPALDASIIDIKTALRRTLLQQCDQLERLLELKQWNGAKKVLISLHNDFDINEEVLIQSYQNLIDRSNLYSSLYLWDLKELIGFDFPLDAKIYFVNKLHQTRLDMRHRVIKQLLQRSDLCDAVLEIIARSAVDEADYLTLHHLVRIQLDPTWQTYRILIDGFTELGDVAQVRSLLLKADENKSHSWQVMQMLKVTAKQGNSQAFNVYWDKLRDLENHGKISPDQSLLSMYMTSIDRVDGIVESEQMLWEIWNGRNGYVQHRSGDMFAILINAFVDLNRFGDADRMYQECQKWGFGEDATVVFAHLRRLATETGNELEVISKLQDLEKMNWPSRLIVNALETLSFCGYRDQVESFMYSTFFDMMKRHDRQAPRLMWVILHYYFRSHIRTPQAQAFYEKTASEWPELYSDPYQCASLLRLIAKKLRDYHVVDAWRSQLLQNLRGLENPAERKIVNDAIAQAYAYCHAEKNVNKMLLTMSKDTSANAQPDSATYEGIISAYLHVTKKEDGFSSVKSLLENLRNTSVVLSPSSLIDLMKGFSYHKRYDMVKQSWDVFYMCYMAHDTRWLSQLDDIVEKDRAAAIYLDAIGRDGTVQELEAAWSTITRTGTVNDNLICSFAESLLLLRKPHRAIQIVLGDNRRKSYYAMLNVKPSMKALVTLFGGLRRYRNQPAFLAVMKRIYHQAEELAANGLVSGRKNSKEFYDSIREMANRMGISS